MLLRVSTAYAMALQHLLVTPIAFWTCLVPTNAQCSSALDRQERFWYHILEKLSTRFFSSRTVSVDLVIEKHDELKHPDHWTEKVTVVFHHPPRCFVSTTNGITPRREREHIKAIETLSWFCSAKARCRFPENVFVSIRSSTDAWLVTAWLQVKFPLLGFFHRFHTIFLCVALENETIDYLE